MLSTRVFRPTIMSGVLYAREVGAAVPLQPVGGCEELTLAIDETKITQGNFESSGGGNRAAVYRINQMTLAAKLQDLNPVNLARSLRAKRSEVLAGTVTDEAPADKALPGGLVRVAHVRPTTVVVRNAATDAVIAAGDNYEVRPEGIWWYDDAVALVAAKAAWVTANPTLDPDDWPGVALEVDYAHSGYDVLEVLTTASPLLEFCFAGVNEFVNGVAEEQVSLVDIWRTQMSATKGFNFISGANFSTLDIEGEVLRDPTKTGAQISKYMRKRMETAA